MRINRTLLVWLWSVVIISYSYISFESYFLGDPYSEVQNRLIEVLDEQRTTLNDLADNWENPKYNKSKLTDYRYPIRVYRDDRLVFWNSNDFIPDIRDIRKNDTLYFDNDSTYVVRRIDLNNGSISNLELFAFLPLKYEYSIYNQNLVPGFNKEIFKGYKVVVENNGQNILSNTLPYHVHLNEELTSGSLRTSIEILLILVILMSVWNLSWRLPWERRPVTSILILISSISILRLSQLQLFPISSFVKSHFFDSLQYVAGWWSPSIGDLIINLILIIIINYHLSNCFLTRKRFAKLAMIENGWLPHLIVLICSLGGFVCAYFIYGLVLNLVSNSQVALDVTTSIQYDSVRISFYLCILLGGIIYFQVNHLLYRYFLKSISNSKTKLITYFIAAGAFLVLVPEYGVVFILIQLLSWVGLQLFGRPYQFTRVRYITLFHMMWISLTVTSLSSFAIYKHFEKRTRIDKQRFADNLLIGNDVFTEYYLGKVIDKTKSDPFIRTRFLNEVLATNQTAYHIERFFPFYLDKYDLNIFLYDKDGDPYGFTSEGNLMGWMSRYFASEPYLTSNEDISFIEDPASGRHKYIGRVEIQNSGEKIGFVILELNLKKYISKSVFPSLLMEASPQANRNSYDYAMYNGDNLLYSQGSFSFETEIDAGIQNLINSRTKFERNGTDFYIVRLQNGNNLIVVSSLYGLNQIFSNISFQFILALLIIGLFYIILRIYQPISEFSLASKIQWYTGLAFVIPILVISIAILNVLNTSYEDEINRNYQKRARNLAENLVNVTSQFLDNSINRNEYQNELDKSSNLVQADMMVYDNKGILLGTNREEVFDLDLLSRNINPKAMDYLTLKKGQIIVLDESIGNLEFKTVYTGITSYQTGEMIGILALPFFNFKNHLSRQQIEVFNNLITLFTMIFLISMIIGNIGLSNLISPIKTIADRLRKVNYLENDTEPLTYNTHDEIGLLVREYNSMLKKLSESKETLAKVQKESAWKEIARQVAHEIKNPLTPMKLKIQQMQRTFEPETIEHKSLNSLLTQVDTLASIADSFSAFAQMPAPVNERFNISELVKSVSGLHHSESLDLTLEIEPDLMVYSDPKILSQVFNNLIINAIQSIEADKKIIHIDLKRIGKKVQFFIKDNGEGIPEDLRDKIFKPYFSTKEKGSGIGLALAKKGIEQAHGDIWYESNEKQGTTFFISLPVN